MVALSSLLAADRKAKVFDGQQTLHPLVAALLHPLLALVVGCFLATLQSLPAAAEPLVSELPLERVVLFTSGVGFFRHGGNVTGDTTVEMSFKAENINDLLKSMVVEDLGGGTVSAVSYASRDPITKTLETFAVNLTDNPSMGQLLGRLRGERIEIEAAAPTTGTIVGVEKRMVPAGDTQPVEKEFLTLLTPEGLRTLPLDTITRIRLLDQRLQQEFEQALAVLALSHDNEKKSVSLAFRGEGEREVRVGYVQEAPVWKTSYRLVLTDGEAGAEAAQKPLLQGWAIVENTTDRDWKDVRMSLVSGRPISFVMDLYRPLYVSRPVVQPELFASLAPQVYGQDLEARGLEFEAVRAKGGIGGGRVLEQRILARQVPRSASPEEAVALRSRGGDIAAGDFFGRSVQSIAAGESLGKLFRYEIATPVSIPRQRSALLPIVAEEIEAERISIYAEQVLAKHPLAGVRLVNTTKLDLMQGPVTVFAGGAYAGDARIEDLPAGSSRLISYAVDLDVEVATQSEPQPEEIVSVKLAKGTLLIIRKQFRRKSFELKNSGTEPETILVEHPLEQGWKLVEPKEPTETTRDRYRFAVTTEPGTPATLIVAEERVFSQQLAVTNLDDAAILSYSSTQMTSPAVTEALADVVERKRAIEAFVQGRLRREEEIKGVEEEQNRIRQNMQQLDRQSDLYSRYVQKFAAQEDRVEKLRTEIAGLQNDEQEARRALDERLATLELE